MIFPVKRLADLGFEILATEGTAEVLRRNGVDAQSSGKHQRRPGQLRRSVILAGEVDLVVNTPYGSPGKPGPRLDGYEIRTAAVDARASRASPRSRAAAAACRASRRCSAGDVGVRSAAGAA